MKTYRSFLIFLFLGISFPLYSQRYITGRITDSETGDPIISASVFIANTTVGVSTDADGNYRLRIPGEGSYRLTISHVGFESVFRDIEPGNSSLKFDAALKSNALEEVTVSARVRFRARDINLFWTTLLGKSPSKRTIYATNADDVFYYFNSETNTLKVTCRVPLQIINNETGYHIQLVLNHFLHDYHSETSTWNYEYKFTELQPEHSRQKSVWAKNRAKVYQLSQTRFLKSLYNNSLMEDGFLLTYINRFGEQNLHQLYETPNTFLSNNSDGSKTLRIPSDAKYSLMLICFGEPVKDIDLTNLNAARKNLYEWSKIGSMQNILETPGTPVRIYSDGTYSNPLKTSAYATSNSLAGLSFILPLEYHPDVDSGISENFAILDENEITGRFEQQLKAYPQEKLHLHTDRDIYIPGEKIWFRAYAVDAHSHHYPTYSRYVYVELISPADTLVNRVMLRQTDGMFFGHLPLTEFIPEGDYTLRAYTRYMENLGDGYFFKKNIRIASLAKNREDGESSGNRESRRNRENQINQINPTNHSQDFDVSFFPEGGNLLEGVFCKVAFKAINTKGHAETVTGKLMDENGVEITSVESYYAGMGIFGYKPVRGKRFYLKCSNASGLEKQFELLQPEPRAWTLLATVQDETLEIEVLQSPQAPDIPLYLLAHCRGKVLYFSEWNTKHELISFPAAEFPAGVIHLVLFDRNMNPLSERLVFNKNNNATAKVEFQTDKAVYEKREKVIVSLSPSLRRRAGAGLSVAVTDDKDIAVDASTTILSTLLLSSELKGYIENPAYFFQDDKALDYLMMTHGWRRYNVAEVVKGHTENPEIPYQTAHEISGTVKNLLRNSPVNNSEVSLVTGGEALLTSTDRNGLFTFPDLDFPDSTAFFIQALDRRGKTNIRLDINEPSYPGLAYAPQSHLPVTPPALATKDTLPAVSTPDTFLEKAEVRAMFDDDIRFIHLEEVTITAQRRNRNEPRLQLWYNAGSDHTITRKQIEEQKLTFVADYLMMIPGIRVNPDGRIHVRGAQDPLVIIDGREYTWDTMDPANPHPSQSPVEKVTANEIESIDVFSGASAAAFGMRGANGVISITTKRGGNTGVQTKKFNYAVYSPLGYQNPVEFYAPKYDTLAAKRSVIPDYRTAIFWKPDIVISEDGEAASFEFYTADFKTTYSVVIEGLTSDGRIVRQVEKIRVD